MYPQILHQVTREPVRQAIEPSFFQTYVFDSS